ncbi:myosin-7B [Prunus yedoensis var. nudiflora]|uniref:Myosin-7B n=1 Tax=Prunus yedoensis var. nudiflora TaxID=2094558 RepID=A0A314YGM0_PRUYE|nr:myosin-7B [Prunus yedoensis var. nudiflora]
MVQKLSAEIVKMHKDLEQKDKILSAMLRKSKLDTTEKHMLLKEIKLSKAKRKQAELETERWKVVSESRHERHSLRSMLEKANSRFEIALNERGANSSATGASYLHIGKTIPQPADALLGYDHSGLEMNLMDARLRQSRTWLILSSWKVGFAQKQRGMQL